MVSQKPEVVKETPIVKKPQVKVVKQPEVVKVEQPKVVKVEQPKVVKVPKIVKQPQVVVKKVLSSCFLHYQHASTCSNSQYPPCFVACEKRLPRASEEE